MKHSHSTATLRFCAILIFASFAQFALAQRTVTKNATTDEITEDLVIPNGRTLTIEGHLTGVPSSILASGDWRSVLGAASAEDISGLISDLDAFAQNPTARAFGVTNWNAALRENRSSAFTAVIGGRYLARGTFSITDPSGGSLGQTYDVIVGTGSVTIGGVAYSPSRFPIIRMHNGSSWVTLGAQITGEVTINGTDLRITGGGSSIPTPESVLTQTRGDARYANRAGLYSVYFGGYVHSNGFTANRAIVQTPGERGNIAGVPACAWRGMVTVPNAPSTAEITRVSSSTSAAASATAWSLGVFWSSNDLVIRANGASAADARLVTFTGLRSSFAGQTVWIEVAFTQGSTAPVLRVNDEVVSGTPSTLGTPPDWLSSSVVATHHVTGFLYPAGPVPLGSWIVGSLTDEDRFVWRTTGEPPLWVSCGGWASNVLARNWNHAGSTPTSWTFANTGYYESYFNGINSPIGVRASLGSRVALSVGTITASAGATVRAAIAPVDSLLTSNSTVEFTYTGGTFRLYGDGGASGVTVSGLFMRLLGAISLPQVQPIYQLDDVTSIAGTTSGFVGMFPVSDATTWRLTARTSTNGNTQIGWGNVVSVPELARVTGWTIRNRDAAATVSLGHTSGGTQMLNSAIVPSGISEPVLITRQPGNALWVSSNSTAELVHTITGVELTY